MNGRTQVAVESQCQTQESELTIGIRSWKTGAQCRLDKYNSLSTNGKTKRLYDDRVE